jgi:hypothetical protein
MLIANLGSWNAADFWQHTHTKIWNCVTKIRRKPCRYHITSIDTRSGVDPCPACSTPNIWSIYMQGTHTQLSCWSRGTRKRKSKMIRTFDQMHACTYTATQFRLFRVCYFSRDCGESATTEYSKGRSAKEQKDPHQSSGDERPHRLNLRKETSNELWEAMAKCCTAEVCIYKRMYI